MDENSNEKGPLAVSHVLSTFMGGNAYTRRLDAHVAVAEAARLNWRWIESELSKPLDENDRTCRIPET
jgi:hypothetical protein